MPTAIGLSKNAAIAALAVTRPLEFVDRMTGRRQQADPPSDLELVPTHNDVISAAHEIAGVRHCYECVPHLKRVGAQVTGRIEGAQDYLQKHHDGGPMLSQLLWVLVRHTRPTTVIETGVARGVSSAHILDAMEANQHGELISIDLPPLGNGWRALVGSAVPPDGRARWTYLRGASSRKLPRAIAEFGPPDIFVHDGLHTLENMLWEYETVWATMDPGALLISDDIDDSYAWQTFSSRVKRQWIVREPDKSGVLAVAQRD